MTELGGLSGGSCRVDNTAKPVPAVEDEVHTVTMLLEVPEAAAELFRPLAGQKATLRGNDGVERSVRIKSVGSLPNKNAGVRY